MHRPINTIEYSSRFVRAAKKLPIAIRPLAVECESLFRKNCLDPRLKTHKLHGRQSDCWSFSLAFRYRILFRFLDKKTVEFLDVGDHSIYQ